MIKTLFAELEEEVRRLDGAEPIFNEDRKVYVYGAGTVGQAVARVLRGRKVPVAGLLDRRAGSGVWEGIPLLRPEQVPAADRAGVHVVIGIFNRDTEMTPIPPFLRGLGYERITTFLEVHRRHAAELGDRFWLTDLRFYRGKEEACSRAAELWADQESQDLFAAVLRFRFTGRYEELPAPCLDDQYFPKGLPAWPWPVRVIDCGAYDGDTVRALLQRRSDVEAIAAFEPDPENFRRLSESVQAQRFGGSACLFPCGVSATTRQLRFASGQGESSRALESGDSMIQCVALDEALPSFRPTLIKMDIEGAEHDALLGARRLIERYRPGLAICVYHRPDDLWTIPLMIKNWLGGGRYFLRAHAYNAFDLIYYWLP